MQVNVLKQQFRLCPHWKNAGRCQQSCLVPPGPAPPCHLVLQGVGCLASVVICSPWCATISLGFIRNLCQELVKAFFELFQRPTRFVSYILRKTVPEARPCHLVALASHLIHTTCSLQAWYLVQSAPPSISR